MAQSECGEGAQRRWGYREGFLQRECFNLGGGFCRVYLAAGGKWERLQAWEEPMQETGHFLESKEHQCGDGIAPERSNSLGLAGAGWCRA